MKRKWLALAWLVIAATAAIVMATHGVSAQDGGRPVISPANAGQLTEIVRMDAPGGGTLWSVAWSPDGVRLATGSDTGQVDLWHAGFGVHLATLTGHTGSVYGLGYSPDGTLLASAGGDGTVRLWDARTGESRAVLQTQLVDVWAVAFSPDGRHLAAGGGGPLVEIFDVASGQSLRTVPTNSAFLRTVVYSPDGTILAMAGCGEGVDPCARGGLILWDLGFDVELARLGDYELGGGRLAFSPQGTHVVMGSDSTLTVWNVATGELDLAIDSQNGQVQNVAYSPDGALISGGSWSDNLQVWNAATGELLALLEDHEGAILGTAFNRDGTMLAAVSGSGVGDVTIYAITAQFSQTIAPTVLPTIEPTPFVLPTVPPTLAPTADPTLVARGQQIFASSCAGCHGRFDGVGPALPGMAQRARFEVPGQTAAEYLRTSIVSPSAHIVAGYANIMPPTYQTQLSAGDIDALIAFMLTQ